MTIRVGPDVPSGLRIAIDRPTSKPPVHQSTVLRATIVCEGPWRLKKYGRDARTYPDLESLLDDLVLDHGEAPLGNLFVGVRKDLVNGAVDLDTG